MTDPLEGAVTGVAALAEPVRRALYAYVTSQADAVSREQAATAVGVPLHAARFNLDRMVEEGLLDTEFRRLTGRTGPGAGRPAKLYRRSGRQFSVTLPPRDYELAGQVLAAAVDAAMRKGVPVQEAVREAATTEGRRLAATSGADDARGTPDDPLDRAAAVLAQHGFEPRRTHSARPHADKPHGDSPDAESAGGADEVRLANCPFHDLARTHTQLVCGLNLALIGGVLEELDAPHVVAELAPQPGMCCVRLVARNLASSG